MTEATLGESTIRIGVMRLRFGPRPSVAELLGALGDALVRSQIVADTVAIEPCDDGFVLCAHCSIVDEVALTRAVHELVAGEQRRDARCADGPTRLRPCSLAG
jgi:hypothetical protein